VILDGVFNHCGRGFFAFNDILENQDQSPYKDWFHILKFPVDAYSPGDAEDFDGWWKYKSLPKFNTNYTPVRKYLLKVAQYWIEQGADGWRLDVPNEIDDDNFWADFRQTVLAVNRDAYILGEIWDGNPRWVGEGKFDGLMNYPVRDALLALLTAKLPVSQFAEKVESLLTRYPRENVYAMYVPIGTHDTPRLLTLMDNDLKKVKLCFQFQFAFPGAPAIYYGDEIGLPGKKDPDNRRAFPWEPASWNGELRSYVQELVALRKRLPVLRRGDFNRVLVDDTREIYVFTRCLGDEKILGVMNTSATRRNMRVSVSDLGWKDGLIVHNLLETGEFLVSGDDLSITINPMTGMWLK
jgi:glycosidase